MKCGARLEGFSRGLRRVRSARRRAVPDLDIRVTGVEPASRGLVPLLHFKLAVTNTPAAQRVHSAMLQAQVQIAAPRRTYDAAEKEKLVELFGTPDRWGQ